MFVLMTSLRIHDNGLTLYQSLFTHLKSDGILFQSSFTIIIQSESWKQPDRAQKLIGQWRYCKHIGTSYDVRFTIVKREYQP